ncbi:RNase3 domain-containing protein [Diplogelasinospora grovesii]|uniref:RNase3 domain-containing protein n=1 Tax=Diplogelasinospora grovesii TaxID=303347 RepID=A0AAN6MVD9_9PEZI|nr:RNase3 domain-containing protein [Diplogelasinospora grovesii]
MATQTVVLPTGAKASDGDGTGTITLVSRAYQTEMYEESLKRNIIVAMDTGSGKTQVAILRIVYELQRMGPGKRIWFLTPTVQLCLQQCEALEQQIRSVQVRSLTSKDDVDKWRNKKLWDDVLANVGVAVATYAVLQNALSSAYVSMESIALIVFDEAHNCVGKSPGAKIMTEFYRHNKECGKPVPCILGLTASPANGSRDIDPAKVEKILDAVCKCPTLHRSSLLAHVKRPTMNLQYYDNDVCLGYTRSVLSLEAVLETLDIQRDPDILRWRSEDTEQSREKLRKALESDKTYVRVQLRSTCRRAMTMCAQMGTLAADFYIAKMRSMIADLLNASDSSVRHWDYSSKKYLADALQRVTVERGIESRLPEPGAISNKVQWLIKILGSQNSNSTRGIIFVTEKASVVVIHHILSTHPRIKQLFRIGALVGSSKYEGGRRDLGDILTTGNQSRVLREFREATSVLEEGIDVAACNLVVCFDEPSSLKAFVQRRGRARKAGSNYIMLMDAEARKSKSAEDWECLEEEMRQQYEKENRESESLRTVDKLERGGRRYRVWRTGALLDLERAKGLLQQFCASVTTKRYADKQPYYVIEEAPRRIQSALISQDPDDHYGGVDGIDESSKELPRLVRAKVVMPAYMSRELRTTWSKRPWLSEKKATKDAAFEAYMKLYRAGLVNDHLLPLLGDFDADNAGDKDGILEVHEQMNPWHRISGAWRNGANNLRAYTLELRDARGQRKGPGMLQMIIPAALLDSMPPIPIHWSSTETWEIKIDRSTKAAIVDNRDLADPDHTAKLLSLAYGHRMQIDGKRQQLAIFSILPDWITIDPAAFQKKNEGSTVMLKAGHVRYSNTFLVRDTEKRDHPFALRSLISSKSKVKSPASKASSDTASEERADDEPHAILERWPPHADLLLSPSLQESDSSDPDRSGAQIDVDKTKQNLYVLRQSRLRLDPVPMSYAEYGLLIPFIMHKVEGHLVAQRLYEKWFAEDTKAATAAGISDGAASETLHLVRSAITAPATMECEYRMLEFVGDACLKLLVTVCYFAKYPEWPEGYLTTERAKVISKARLCDAAQDRGLDKYVLMRTFSAHKWRPTYRDDIAEASRTKPPSKQNDNKKKKNSNADDDEDDTGEVREMASKTLADVLKALIGAGLQSGGHHRALTWAKRLLPELDLPSLEVGRRQLYDLAPSDDKKGADGKPLIAESSTLQSLEALAGYRFNRRALLVEAMSHSSDLSTPTSSYDRLAFLGDAIIESIVADEIYAHHDRLSHHQMDTYRAAVVNGYYLGFVALDWHTTQKKVSIQEKGSGWHSVMEAKAEEEKFPLFRFMRYHSREVSGELEELSERFTEIGPCIKQSIESGKTYPWAKLARLQANHLVADLVKSLVAAIWVDSWHLEQGTGSMRECTKVLERMGILPYLRRIISDQVHTVHPKQELQGLTGSKLKEVKYSAKKEETGEWTCAVYFEGNNIAEASGGLHEDEAQIEAAMKAVEALKKATGKLKDVAAAQG